MGSKDFDVWNGVKKDTHQTGLNKFYNERDIWWCAFGVNIGVESDGKGVGFTRPVVIIKGFSKESFLGIAVTGVKKQNKYYLYLGTMDDTEMSANLSQIRVFDTKRLVKKMGMLNQGKYHELMERIVALLRS